MDSIGTTCLQNDNGAESSAKECANLFKHKPFMDLYLINAATDAKRQPCFHITEANKSCVNEMTGRQDDTFERLSTPSAPG